MSHIQVIHKCRITLLENIVETLFLSLIFTSALRSPTGEYISVAFKALSILLWTASTSWTHEWPGTENFIMIFFNWSVILNKSLNRVRHYWISVLRNTRVRLCYKGFRVVFDYNLFQNFWKCTGNIIASATRLCFIPNCTVNFFRWSIKCR